MPCVATDPERMLLHLRAAARDPVGEDPRLWLVERKEAMAV
jgi:hypothetical protein